MAEIFLARETGLAGFERYVIIKRILPNLLDDVDFIDMFLDEARLAARLTHPNIVHIYELGEEEGAYYIAMEYVPGGDLHALVSRRPDRGVPLGEALYLTREVCAGLQFAHALAGPDGEPLGVVHRDVTPKNVLISVDGVVKIVDFGIAKARAKLSVTRPGDIKGTFAYMAPEQARGATVDRRADVYAVGALTYRLVTGKPAYPQTGDSLLSAVRANQFLPPRQVNPLVPQAVEDIIMRAMALDPRDRYRTCGALRRELCDVAKDFGLGGDAESLAALVRTTFPKVPGWNVAPDAPEEELQAVDVQPEGVHSELWRGLQPAGPHEATGVVEVGHALDERLATHNEHITELSAESLMESSFESLESDSEEDELDGPTEVMDPAILRGPASLENGSEISDPPTKPYEPHERLSGPVLAGPASPEVRSGGPQQALVPLRPGARAAWGQRATRGTRGAFHSPKGASPYSSASDNVHEDDTIADARLSQVMPHRARRPTPKKRAGGGRAIPSCCWSGRSPWASPFW